MVVAEVFVFIEEDRTLVLTPPPCWASNPEPVHAVEILPLTHAQCHLVIESAPRNNFGEVFRFCSALFTLPS